MRRPTTPLPILAIVLLAVASVVVGVLIVLPFVSPAFPWIWPGHHPHGPGEIPDLFLEVDGGTHPGNWISSCEGGGIGIGYWIPASKYPPSPVASENLRGTSCVKPISLATLLTF